MTVKHHFFSAAHLVNRKSSEAYYLSILLAVLAGLRYGTGTDFFSYLYTWHDIRPIYTIFSGRPLGYDYIEYGFTLFASVLKVFTSNEIVFFMAMAWGTMWSTYKGIKKFGSIYLIGGLYVYFMIFYVPYVYNGMRQAISMGIFIYSMHEIISQRFTRVLFLAFIAMSFHSSGIFILAAYFVNKIKIKLNYFLIGGFILLLIFIELMPLSLIFQTLGLKLYYLEVLTRPTSIFQLITRSVVACFLLIGYNIYVKKSINGDVFSSLLKIYFFGLFVYFYFSDINVFASRINMFFRVLEVILFPMLLFSVEKVYEKVIIFSLITFLGVYIFISIIQVSDNDYYFNF